MTERDNHIRAFLAATDWRDARRDPLPGDASFRRYERLVDGPAPALLMDAPPPEEDVRSFVRIARHLTHLGLSAPAIHAADEDRGLLVLEDFGDDTYTRLLGADEDETALYELATDTLIALHQAADAAIIDVPPYDFEAYLREARLLTDWFLPAMDAAPDAIALAAYEAAWQALLPLANAVPKTLVLRDFHIDNLMALPNRMGVQRCGLLDFQDALIGSVAYDMISLLHDARRDVPAEIKRTMTERYLAAFPEIDPEGFAAAAAMLSAQRNCKIIGIFTRLSRRDGKPGYLGHIPRVWRLLEDDLAHPALRPLADWLNHHAPSPLRRAPAA
jgi:aminoglycoside/choline kinase family phosphotransferase